MYQTETTKSPSFPSPQTLDPRDFASLSQAGPALASRLKHPALCFCQPATSPRYTSMSRAWRHFLLFLYIYYLHTQFYASQQSYRIVETLALGIVAVTLNGV